MNLSKNESLTAAEEGIRQLIHTDPNEGYYWWALADILRSQENHEAGLAAVEHAVTLDPNNVAFTPRLADLMAKTGDLTLSDSTYLDLISKHPERRQYWFWYARFLVDHYPDRHGEASKLLDEATAPEKTGVIDANELTQLRDRITEMNTVSPK